MSLTDLASQVLNSVRGDTEAIMKLSIALMSRDSSEIRSVLRDVAGLQMAEEELI